MVFASSEHLKVRLVLCLAIVTAVHLAGFTISLPEAETQYEDAAVGVVLVPWQQDNVAIGGHSSNSATTVAEKPAPEKPPVVDNGLVKNNLSPSQQKPPTINKQTEKIREIPVAAQPLMEKQDVATPELPEPPAPHIKDISPVIQHQPSALSENPELVQQSEVAREISADRAEVAAAETATQALPETSTETLKEATAHRNDQQAKPRYGHHPPPAYPRIARQRGWQGIVEFEVRVLPSGKVVDLVLKSSSDYRILDEAARKAIAQWRFSPATRSGTPIESWVVVPVEFVLDTR